MVHLSRSPNSILVAPAAILLCLPVSKAADISPDTASFDVFACAKLPVPSLPTPAPNRNQKSTPRAGRPTDFGDHIGNYSFRASGNDGQGSGGYPFGARAESRSPVSVRTTPAAPSVMHYPHCNGTQAANVADSIAHEMSHNFSTARSHNIFVPGRTYTFGLWRNVTSQPETHTTCLCTHL